MLQEKLQIVLCSDNNDCPRDQVCRDNHCDYECVVNDNCKGADEKCVDKKCVGGATQEGEGEGGLGVRTLFQK